MTRALLAAIALIAAACHVDVTGPVITGTYDLSRINGASLPAPFPEGLDGVPATATRGLVIIEGNAQWRAEITFMVTIDGTPLALNRPLSGTYTMSRDTIYFRDGSGGTVDAAVLSGGRLTASLEGMTFEFVRR